MGRPIPVEDYQRLIWDFDGTLYALTIDWERLKREVAALAPTIESGVLSEMLAVARRLGLADEAFGILARHEAAALDADDGWIPENVEVFVRNADRSVIVSNNLSVTIRRFLALVGRQQVPFVTRDLVQRPKPDPEGLKRISAFWEGRPTLLIGDSDIDRRLAATAGIDFHCVGSRAGRWRGEPIE